MLNALMIVTIPSTPNDFMRDFLNSNNRYYKDHKNSPEMNVSEGDLIPVKILSKSVEKLKSYRISLEGPFFP